MESPVKEYKRLSKIDNIKELAYYEIFTKYIVENLKNAKKLSEIDSTNQEQIIRRFNGGFPLPGFIYTFIYPPKKGEELIIKDGRKERKYNDYVPLVFCTNIKDEFFKGINLNTLPPLARLKFFETYFNMYESFFKDVEVLTENNKLAINDRYVDIALSPKGFDIIKLFNAMTNANFNYGFRTYDMKKIKQLRMIEYSEWAYINFYNPKNAFKLMNQKQIQDLYYKSL